MINRTHNDYTVDELQAQYSARAAVPEHPEIFERWRRDSEQFRLREAPAAQLDIVFGERPRQRLDLFHPDGRTPAPLHVFLHGGYWQSMDRRDFSFVARNLNARGIAVAVVGYSLCPDVTIAMIIDEVRGGIAWLHENRTAHRIDDRPLRISGHSAGGHMAVMLATTPVERLGGATIDWIAPISGVFDLEPLVSTGINNALGLDATTARRLDAVHCQPVGPLAADAWVGALESAEFHRQSTTFVKHLGNHVQANLHVVPGCNHFTVLDTLFAMDSALIQRAAKFRPDY